MKVANGGLDGFAARSPALLLPCVPHDGDATTSSAAGGAGAAKATGAALPQDILLLHGEADFVVPPAQSLAMHAALLAQGAQYDGRAEVELFEGVGHSEFLVNAMAGDAEPVLERTLRFCRRAEPGARG